MGPLRIDEVLQLAMQAEECGIAFYEAVARQSPHREVADLCRRLSNEEQDHLQTFRDLREAVLDRGRVRRLELEEVALLQEMVDHFVLPERKECERLAAEGTVREILETAVRMESDAVDLYTKLRHGVDDAGVLHRIVDEEKQHLQDFTELLKRHVA